MSFKKGWSKDAPKPEKYFSRPFDFFILKSDNPDPEKARKERRKTVVFLDGVATFIPIHSYFDPRLNQWQIGSKGAVCVADIPGYQYCPYCEAKRVHGKNARITLNMKAYFTIFDLSKYNDKITGIEKMAGKKLLPADEKVLADLEEESNAAKQKDPSFSLVGAQFVASRRTNDSSATGDSWRYEGKYDLTKLPELLKLPDAATPFDYETVFKPLPFSTMENDVAAILGKPIPSSKLVSASPRKQFGAVVPDEEEFGDEVPF